MDEFESQGERRQALLAGSRPLRGRVAPCLRRQAVQEQPNQAQPLNLNCR